MVEIMVSVPRVVTEVERVEAAIKTLNVELINLSDQVRAAPRASHGLNFGGLMCGGGFSFWRAVVLSPRSSSLLKLTLKF